MSVAWFPVSFVLLYSFLIGCPATVTQENGNWEWTSGPAPTNPFQYNVALPAAGKIYVAGGDNDGAFERYDPVTGMWVQLPKLPTPRVFAGGTVLGDSLFVIGGLEDLRNTSAAVEIFSISQHAWSKLPELSFARSRLATVSCNGKIYVMGGLAGETDAVSTNSATTECFDPATGRWMRLQDMPTPRHGHAAVVYHGKIWVAGGYTADGPTATVEVFDPVTGQWTTKKPMNIARGFFGLVTIDTHGYAIAGRIHHTGGSIEQYDFQRDQWHHMGSLPVSLNRFGIATVGNTIYIVGGEETPRSMWIGNYVNDR